MKTVFLLLIFAGLGYTGFCYVKSFTMYNVINEALSTDKGYNEDVSPYMSEEMFNDFNRTDLLKSYPKHVKNINVMVLYSYYTVNGEGKIWLRYTYELFDDNGNQVLSVKDASLVLKTLQDANSWRITEKTDSSQQNSPATAP